MQDFKKLKVWEKAHQLVLDIYRVTADFLSDERYGLTSQMRRAATSIPTNIAEGCGRDSNSDMARFLQIAIGSASELEYQLFLSRDLAFLQTDLYLNLDHSVIEVKKMLTALIKQLRQS